MIDFRKKVQCLVKGVNGAPSYKLDIYGVDELDKETLDAAVAKSAMRLGLDVILPAGDISARVG